MSGGYRVLAMGSLWPNGAGPSPSESASGQKEPTYLQGIHLESTTKGGVGLNKFEHHLKAHSASFAFKVLNVTRDNTLQQIILDTLLATRRAALQRVDITNEMSGIAKGDGPAQGHSGPMAVFWPGRLGPVIGDGPAPYIFLAKIGGFIDFRQMFWTRFIATTSVKVTKHYNFPLR